MPEALALVLVFLIAGGVYVVLLVQSRNPALHDPRKEHARLEQHLAWLDQRLAMARREKWGQEMVAPLLADQTASTRALARVRASLDVTRAPARN
jgi:hypothetical protein